MILRKEIASFATQKGVPGATIDKDWALGHFLDAIFSLEELRKCLVFKGGTCLRKCYIPDYRFSEDLDFTSKDPSFRLSVKHLSEITGLIGTRTGMRTYTESLKELISKERLTGFEAVIKFWGADHPGNEVPPPPRRWLTKVKIEIILFEVVTFPVSNLDITHPYSDKLSDNARQVPCYSVEEMLSEKMRSLVQRSYAAPRDLYDLWYLSRNFTRIDMKKVAESFIEKMAFKGYSFTGIEQLLNPENEKSLQASWNNSLSHQIPDGIPLYDEVRAELHKWLEDMLTGKS